MTNSTTLSLKPSPGEWLSLERLKELETIFSSSLDLLNLSGQLNSSIHFWIRCKIADEAYHNEEIWPVHERDSELRDLIDRWKSTSTSDLQIKDSLLKQKLMIKPGCDRWSCWHWQYRVDSLFLDNKQKLDQVRCVIVKLDNKNKAQELYYRLLANETFLDDLVSTNDKIRLLEATDKEQPLQSVSKLPYGLGEFLHRLKVGEISPPLRIKDHFLVKENL